MNRGADVFRWRILPRKYSSLRSARGSIHRVGIEAARHAETRTELPVQYIRDYVYRLRERPVVSAQGLLERLPCVIGRQRRWFVWKLTPFQLRYAVNLQLKAKP